MPPVIILSLASLGVAIYFGVKSTRQKNDYSIPPPPSPSAPDFAAQLSNALASSSPAPSSGIGTNGGPNAASLASTGASIAGVAGVGVLAGALESITNHHNAAMTAEANALNRATPYFYEGLTVIFAAVQAKKLTASQANALIDQEVAQYLTSVKSLMTGDVSSMAWVMRSNAGPPKDDAGQNIYFVQTRSVSVNGPGVVYGDWIKPDALKLKYYVPRILAGKTGDFWLAVGGIPVHAGFQGIAGPLVFHYGAKASAPVVAPQTITAKNIFQLAGITR